MGADTAVEVETFAALSALPWLRHAFTHRHTVPDFSGRHAQCEAFREALSQAWGGAVWRLAEQVHGARVAVVDQNSPEVALGCDALCTRSPGLILGISVADCGPVWVVCRKTQTLGLAHSGRKGTEGNIVGELIGVMTQEWGADPEAMIVQIGPCIRPPQYDVEFAATIVEQAKAAGVRDVNDCGINTGARVDRYFSYRVERGTTGRMVACGCLFE
jgi:copper oxidase (laccase) domain-containing protein